MSEINQQNIANIINAQGTSPFVLICEHASHYIPTNFNNLGLTEQQITSHIGWDIGAQALSEQLSALLNAPLILQTYSRLLYDCNRPVTELSAIPEKSEETIIPGNCNLSSIEKEARARDYYYPFHRSVSQFLDEREASIIVTIHSFNPIYRGIERTVDIGIINDIDPTWAASLTAAAQQTPNIEVAQNQPYSAADGVTHTLQLHGRDRSIDNVMIEVKNNLIDCATGQQYFAKLLNNLLRENHP